MPTLKEKEEIAKQLGVARTPAPGCAACEAQRLHTPDEKAAYHPLAGHGYIRERGWTHPSLEVHTNAQK